MCLERRLAEWFIDDLDKLRQLLFFDPNGKIATEIMPAQPDEIQLLMFLRPAKPRPAWVGIRICTIRNCRSTCTA